MPAELSPPSVGAREHGFGLIEVLITVAIVSIAFVAILSAISVMIVTGAQHRDLTRAEALARNAAEYVKSSSVPYADCATSYDLTGLAKPPHFTAAVSAVKVWDGNDPAGYSPTCTTDTGVQQVTVTVARTGGSEISQTLSFVKREA